MPRQPPIPPWLDRNATQVDTLALTRRRSAAVRRIGEYELIREIGSGGMATVWEATRPLLGGSTKVVALKLMSRELSSKPKYRKMFIKEANVSTKLHHKNIVQVTTVGEQDAQYYLEMEWVDGMNLAQLLTAARLRGRWISHVLTAYIIGELLEGLAYAQAVTDAGAPMGVVHRDISPQNVLVSASGEVKLTDFGVARLASDETSRDNAPGKLRYMAPEQLRGRSRDPSVDLYAVGAMLHELLDGRVFRDATDERDMFDLVLSGHVPELAHPEEVPRELDLLRQRLVEADPERRVRRAVDALELLERWPGYRNASRDLARVCQAYMGVSAPRSGVHQAAVLPTPSGERTQTAATREASGSQPAGRLAPVTEVDIALPADVRLAPAVSYPVGLVIGLTAALVAAVGVGGVALWRGGLAPAPTGAAESAAAPAAGQPEPVAAAAPAPTSEAARVATPTPATDPVENEPGPVPPSPEPDRKLPGEAASSAAPAATEPSPKATPSEPAAQPQPAPAKAKGKAEVTFKTGEFTFVWVKVKGKVLALEPLKKVELPSGKHRVYFRLSDKDPWAPAGRIEIEPSRSYEVRMKKPGSLELRAI